MNQFTGTMEGITDLPSSLQVETLTVEGPSYPYLTLVPLGGGGFARTYPIYRHAGRVPASSITGLSVTGADLGRVRLFLIIDGILCSYILGAWAPVSPQTLPYLYPVMGLPLAAVTDEALAKVFLDERQHSVGVALLMDTDTVISPKVREISFSYQTAESVSEVHLTHITGSFPIASGFSVPKRFRVELSMAVVVYRNAILTSKAVEVVPNQTTGLWDVWLPDTESMAESLAGYLFYFNNFTPVARKVPKVDTIEFRSLPIYTGA